MQKSPCATYQHGHESKDKIRCRDCERRIAYADSLDPGVQCRNDPAYQMSYSTPAVIRSRMPYQQVSTWDYLI